MEEKLLNEMYVLETFEYLHGIPEIGGKEYKTSKFIKKELIKFGYTIDYDESKTWVIAEKDSGVDGPILVIRADMDALEFIEGEKTKYIHACGHDANSSMVLAVAKEYSKKDIKRGKLIFLFQPDEENGKGAKMIIKTSKLNEVDEIVGIHLRPVQEAVLGEATPALCHGASVTIDVSIKGVPSHAARPHLGVNAVDAGAMVVLAINSIRVDPRVSSSAKVTKFISSGKASNIIPDRVELAIDVRAQNNNVMDELIKKIKDAVKNSAINNGSDVEINIGSILPAADYDEGLVNIAKSSIEEVLGKSLPPILTPGGEDFHNYPKYLNVKTAYIGLGADLIPGLHNPNVKFNKQALMYGQRILSKIVEKRLG